MNLQKNYIIIIILIIFLIFGFVLVKLITKFRAPEVQMPIPVVTVAKPQQQDVIIYYEFTGTTAAIEEVEVRARVQGYLQKIHFVEGSDIKKDDLLFEIEPELFQAQRDQAYAMMKSSEAELLRAELDLKRVQEAIKTNAVSQQQVSTRKAERDKADAAFIANKAILAEAELNLSYTKIHSPIDGRISRKMVDVGNLVGAGEQTLLATVVKLQPIYIYFNVSEGFMLNNLGLDSLNGKSKLKIFVGLESENNYPHEGILDYMDNVVDAGTGTILLRGQLPNTDKKILPGMFVRVKIPIGQQSDALLVNERSLLTDIGGKYLLLVNKDNQVERRSVQIGQQVGDMRVITSGLTIEDTYILKGLQFIYPGNDVSPQLTEDEQAKNQNSEQQDI